MILFNEKHYEDTWNDIRLFRMIVYHLDGRLTKMILSRINDAGSKALINIIGSIDSPGVFQGINQGRPRLVLRDEALAIPVQASVRFS